MAEDPGVRLTVVSLNTWGVPGFGTRLGDRCAATGAALDGGDADVACLQEVFSFYPLHKSQLDVLARVVGGVAGRDQG